MSEHWCREKLENLKIEENCLNTLTEIRSRLNESASLESIITNRLLSSPEIYDCIKDGENSPDSKEKMRVVNDILEICMSNITITQNDFPQLLQKALTHPQSRVRAIALNTILKELQKSLSQGKSIEMSDDLLSLVLKALKQNETECGVPALAILSLVLDDYIGRREVQENLNTMLRSDEVVKCRVYELAVNLAKKTPLNLNKVKNLLDSCLSELDNDDVLMQVNILEILYPLAEVPHGVHYLIVVFDLLNGRVQQIKENPINRILLPGILKFYGKIASLNPHQIQKGYPILTDILFECFESGEMDTLPAALDTLANLASTPDGKIFLERFYENKIRDAMRDIGSYLRNMNLEMKKRIISSMMILFAKDENIEALAEISEVLHRWYLYLSGSQDMEFLFQYCRNPFPDVKAHSLDFTKVLCSYEWGVTSLKSTAGFIEFLLDRKHEFDKDVKYLKYEVISILAETSAFDVQTTAQLKTYVKEGPFYQRVQMEVAVEGD